MITHSITLAKHIQTGEIVHVKNARNGLQCNCICVECGEKLEAIQGILRKWHFRHNINKSCPGGQESALHQAAKEIIKKNQTIKTEIDTVFEYEVVYLEKTLDNFQIDVLLENSANKMAIEIAVTHFIGTEKETFFKQSKINSIEIDLSKVNRQISLSELEDLLIHQSKLKRTIYPDIPVPVTKVQESETDDSWIIILIIAVLGFFGIRSLFKKKGSRKNQRRRY